MRNTRSIADEGQTLSLEYIGQAQSIAITDTDGNTVYPGLSTTLATYDLILV